MSQSINWLHLSDLHFGLDRQGWLWPGVKHEFFRDLEKVTTDIGGWDLVFFTGDLTQRGGWDEFGLLSKDLQELWTILTKSGNTPKLCVVPGNHDLVRPSQGSAIAKTFTQLWSTDLELRRVFWSEKACEYRGAVRSFFENFTKWTSAPPVPMLLATPGVLPGDFSATFEKGGTKLGIVGLNSTFLQISSGDFKGRLDLHVSQLNQVCDGDPTRWLKDRTATVLLSHQPPSWLAPEALQHFRQEIYPPGRFLAQLCGHQHEPEAFETIEAGAAPRRLRQAPSLFGLETWEGPTPEKRIHGYSAGQYVFDRLEGHEVLLPRIAVPGRHGGLNLAPDHSFKLLDDNTVLTSFELDTDAAEDNASVGTATNTLQVCKDPTPGKPELQLLETCIDEASARTRLTAAPRVALAFGPQHRFIRQEEQSQFELELRRSRCIWLVADWGTGNEGFLGASLDRFRGADQTQDVFHLRCDDAADPEAFEALFPQQTGMPLQTFCTLVASLGPSFLVLDGIHPNLCRGAGLEAITRIGKAVIDYCPNLRLILISRLSQEQKALPTVELRPLDVPDVRTYLLHHPDAPPALHEPDIVEKLHERTDGLPMHLDRILRALKVSTLQSVLEAEMEGTAGPAAAAESTPNALVHAVSSLANSKDKRSRRSFRLLQVLSVLPYGETLESLEHYLPTEPFFPENALQLHEAALLDVIPLQQINPNVPSARAGEETAPKLLKVPRQVRDYSHTLLSDGERWEIVLSGAERFFGRQWRSGKIKLRSLPPEYSEYLSSGPGNEFAIIHYIISHGRSTRDEALVRRGQLLAIQYARHLNTAERYRDLAIVAGELTQLLESDKYPKEWATLAGLAGAGLRMMGKHDEALKHCRRALEIGGSLLTGEERAELWLDVALTEEKLGNVDEAIAAAQEVKANVHETSPRHLQASAILANALEAPEKAKQLPSLEEVARKKGFHTVANNIALDLAKDAATPEEELKHLDRVLAGRERSYNQVRAIVSKADAIAKSQTPKELKPQEVTSLVLAYSYLHAQRFGSLFDKCHRVLWQVFEKRGETPPMLRLFRHSSFVWRIRGDEEKEAAYLKRLSKRDVQSTPPAGANVILLELGYFLKRVKAVLSSTTPLQQKASPPKPADAGSAQ